VYILSLPSIISFCSSIFNFYCVDSNSQICGLLNVIPS
jgi:hypothetical protein